MARAVTLTQEELNKFTFDNVTSAQKTMLEDLMSKGFKIYRCERRNDVVLPFVTHPNTFGLVYPDGALHRGMKGKSVTYNWDRAQFLYEQQTKTV